VLVAGGAGAWIADSLDGTVAGQAARHPGGAPASATPGLGGAAPGYNPNSGTNPNPGIPPGAGVHGPPPRLPDPGGNRPPPRQLILFSQTTGSSRTIFKAYGYGWPPGGPLTLTLMHAGADDGSQQLSADPNGNFNDWINLDHTFVHGGLPQGSYRVVVTGVSGIHAAASFTVRQLAP
jgi:hypothetical protein